jgi:WD40 repeat protein
MINTEKKDGQRLRRARTATVLISLVAISAVVFAVYAFQQKKKAEEQTNFAMQKAVEAMQEKQNAVKAQIEADTNREGALRQAEIAQANARIAIEQQQIADSQTKKAKENEIKAIQQKSFADQQRAVAEWQAEIARKKTEELQRQTEITEEQKSIVKSEKQISVRLKELENSRSMASESIILLNENLFDSSRHVALQAYRLNQNNNGPVQNNDIYNALNSNWIKSINYSNRAALHLLPVHCITGMPGNIIFTADESGIVCESVIKNNGLQKIASYPTKEEVRALAVSGDGSKLAAVTAEGNGFIFSVSASNIILQKNFKFQGIGKDVAFDDNKNLIVLSNKGFTKYHLAKMDDDDFINRGQVNAFAIGTTGKIYVAFANEINVYNNWNDVVNDKKTVLKKFDSKVTSVAVDKNERCLAGGTYNGFITLLELKSNNEVWSKALHSSSVNALKFNNVADNVLQLASAGSDQTIKLINVNAILQKNFNEDIITLKGHTKWVYDLYYTPDGHWLFSTGEDNKVIAWKTTMKDLYLTLNAH